MSSMRTRKSHKRSSGPFTKASNKKRMSYRRRSRSPISTNLIIDVNKNEILQKYPIYKFLKMAHLGLRPKRIPLKTVNRFIEEILEKIGKLSKKKFKYIFKEEHGFSTFVLDYFTDKLGSTNKGKLKKCEHTIINFLYSIELYKEECPLSLIFGQLLAEMYGSDLTIFISELRMLIQSEVGKSLIKHVSNKPSLDTYRVPFKKIRYIISLFMSKGTMSEHSVESFMQMLIDRFPSLKVDYCLEYKKLLQFTGDLFIHKRQISKDFVNAKNGSVKKSNPGTKEIDNLVFMDDYDIFKTKNMQVIDEDYQDLIEICKFRIAELAERFIIVIMEDAMMDSYQNAVRLKSLLTDLGFTSFWLNILVWRTKPFGRPF